MNSRPLSQPTTLFAASVGIALALAGGCGPSAPQNASVVPVAAGSPRAPEQPQNDPTPKQSQPTTGTTPTSPTATPAQTRPSLWDSAFLEESSAPIFLQLERTNVFMYEAYTMVGFTPWRRTTPEGASSSVRMGFGSGMGLQSSLQQTINAEAEAGGYADMLRWMGMAANHYDEAFYFQLDSVAIDRVIAFVEGVQAIDMRRPAACVNRRIVEAAWGDLHLRRDGRDMYVWIAGDVGAWAPLHPSRFIAGLREAQRRLRELEAAPPSVTW